MPESVKVRRRSLVGRSEIADVRPVRLAAEVHSVELPDDFHVAVNVDVPDYTIRQGRLFVRVAHHVDFMLPRTDDKDGNGADDADVKLGEIHVTHVAVIEVAGDEPAEAEIDRSFVDNTVFTIHPYARAAVQRLSVEVGLPAVVLPYLKRRAMVIAVEKEVGNGGA